MHKKNKNAQALTRLRNLLLTPERRKEISDIAAKKSVSVRREMKLKKALDKELPKAYTLDIDRGIGGSRENYRTHH